MNNIYLNFGLYNLVAWIFSTNLTWDISEELKERIAIDQLW